METVERAIFAFNPNDHHDAEGTIFYRTDLAGGRSGWYIARNRGLNENDCYVREYNTDGSIHRHVALGVVRWQLEHGDPLTERLERNKAKVIDQVVDFYVYRNLPAPVIKQA